MAYKDDKTADVHVAPILFPQSKSNMLTREDEFDSTHARATKIAASSTYGKTCPTRPTPQHTTDFCPSCGIPNGCHVSGCPLSDSSETKKPTANSHASEKPSREVSPRANFACVTLVFLEDWQAGRLTSDEVCETLLAAAVARRILKAPKPDIKPLAKTKSTKKIEIDSKNHDHMVETAQLILNESCCSNAHELAELFLHFAKEKP